MNQASWTQWVPSNRLLSEEQNKIKEGHEEPLLSQILRTHSLFSFPLFCPPPCERLFPLLMIAKWLPECWEGFLRFPSSFSCSTGLTLCLFPFFCLLSSHLISPALSCRRSYADNPGGGSGGPCLPGNFLSNHVAALTCCTSACSSVCTVGRQILFVFGSTTLSTVRGCVCMSIEGFLWFPCKPSLSHRGLFFNYFKCQKTVWLTTFAVSPLFSQFLILQLFFCDSFFVFALPPPSAADVVVHCVWGGTRAHPWPIRGKHISGTHKLFLCCFCFKMAVASH